MPTSSEAQHSLMEAAAHEPGGVAGIPQAVAQEFVNADSTPVPIDPQAGAAGRAAGILFLTPDGETLLLRRGGGGDFPHTFGLPGGHLEEGETDEQAARRECLEETGFAYEGPLARLRDDGQFVSFLARGVDQFPVTCCDESTGYVWCKPEEAPEPLHPGMREAFRIAAISNELDVIELIRDGVLPSPQQFSNSWYFALRITGTGLSFRSKIKEHVWRDPGLYLNPRFLQRCNGLPVIWMHPEKDKLDSKSYVETNIGSIVCPYVRGDEVWGIARIIEETSIPFMRTGEMSTSPGLVFADSEVSVKVPLEDETQLLIEGNSFLIDHLAVCEYGVWDKAGPAEGVQVDQPIEVNMAGENAGAATMVDSATPPVKVETMLSEILAGFGKLHARMDSFEKNMPAAALTTAADSAEEAEAKARKDSEEKAKMKADSEEKEKAKADAEEKARCDAEEKMKADSAKKDEDEAAYADSQARADSVYALFGKSAARRLDGEDLMAYRRRLVRPMQIHSGTWKDSKLEAIADSNAFGIVEAAIYADAAAASRVTAGPGGVEREIHRVDRATGRRITEFAGPVGCWTREFRAAPVTLARINKDF